MRSLVSELALPAGHSRQRLQKFFDRGCHTGAGISLDTFAVLEFYPLPYLQYRLLCLIPLRLAQSLSAAFGVFRGCMVLGFSTALKCAVTYSTFCVACISRRSNMNRTVSVDVSFVVLSMTLLASVCTLSSLADLSVTWLCGVVFSDTEQRAVCDTAGTDCFAQYAYQLLF